MVTFSRISPFALLFVAWASIAEDSNVLLDNTKGIDNTLGPAATELNNLSKSLKSDEDFEPEATIEEAAEENSGAIPDETPGELSEPTVLIDNTKGIDNTLEPAVIELNDQINSLNNVEDSEPEATTEEAAEEIPDTDPDSSPSSLSEPTVLIDKTKGIDKTIDPEAIELKELSDSLKNIEKTIPTTAIEPPVVSLPVTTTPDKSVGIAPAPTLPDISYKANETKEQKAATIENWTPRNSDLRILEVRVAQYKLDDVIAAYQYEDIVLLPLGALAEMLDLAISVQPGSAQGFIIREDWTFILDTTRTEVILQGIPEKYDRLLIRELDDDIYVESALLSRWLLMTFDIDLFSSRMTISSKEKLPFIKRLEREERIAKSLARLNVKKQVYPKHYEQYKDWSVPFVDQNLQLGIQKNQNGETHATYQSTTYATADLLKHEASGFLSINDQDKIDDVRVTFGRTDHEGELLGFMKARKYSFGHVSEPRLGLITTSGSQEAGVSVSNYPIGIQTEYDRNRFIGDLLPGWEVELYQNNALIGYQQTSNNEGQYDFPDIPLLFGTNNFRLVFYGPQGQVREETQTFELSQSLTKKGEHYYRATATQDEIEGSRTTAQYDYGINKNISSSFALASIPLDEVLERNQHTYLKAGLRGFWSAFLGSIDFIDDSAGGSAIDLSLQTRAGSTVFGFEEILLNKYFSEEFKPSDTELTQRTTFRIDTAIPPSFLPRIPVSLQFKQDEFADGGNRQEITNQISTNVRGFAISNLLTKQTTTGQQSLSNGTLQVSTNIERLRVRGSLSYELEPASELTNLALTVDPGEYENYRLSFGINHSLSQDLTEYSVTANKLTGKYNLSFGVRANSNNEINLNLGLSIGIGYEPRRNQWESNARTVANQGSVSARVFIDSDQDGIFGENDAPLQDVGFRLNGGYSQDVTDEDGIVFMTGLFAHEPTNVVISPETLIDPLWTPALDGVQVVPRPGKAILLDFPIFMSGEVDGTVYLSKDGREFGVGKVTVELVDNNNRVLKTTETAYDGFYVLEKVPVGSYRLRVSNNQLEKLGLRAESEETVTINLENVFINGIDFTLLPK